MLACWSLLLLVGWVVGQGDIYNQCIAKEMVGFDGSMFYQEPQNVR